MELSLEGKTVLVTGSTAGIGKEIAGSFATEGAKVVINGRSADHVAAAAAELAPLGTVMGIAADVSSAEEVDHLCSEARALGDIDILVSNVGIFEVKAFAETTDSDWFHYFNVNVMGSVRLCRKILPAMLARGTGRIIIIASEAGVKPMPEMIHYSVTKTALLGLARGLAELTRGTDVTVNSVLVGPTWTEGAKNYFEGVAELQGKPLEEVTTDFFKKENPSSIIQRFIQVEEVAQLVLFLSTASAINGSAQRIEGGIIRSIL